MSYLEDRGNSTADIQNSNGQSSSPASLIRGRREYIIYSGRGVTGSEGVKGIIDTPE